MTGTATGAAAPRTSPAHEPPRANRGAVRPVRPGLLAAVLALEVLTVALRHWWVDLLGEFREVSALLVTLAVTIGVFAGDRLRRALELVAAHGRGPFPWGLGLLQVGAFAGFVLFTRYVVATDLQRGPAAGAWLAAWACAGLGVVALWCRVVMPWRGWRELIRRGRRDAALAATVVAIAWGASRYSQHLWRGLADDTLRAVEFVLRLSFDDVTVAGAEHRIGARGFVVEIAPACSGYEGFGLIAAVIGCYLWLCRTALRFPAALVLLPLGLAASWALNVARIAALIAIGALGWPVVAVGGFHTQAGWLAFNATAIGLIVLSRSSSLFRRAPTEAPARAPRGPNPAAPLLVPLLVIVGAAMVTGAVSAGGIDRLYAVRVLIAGLVLWTYRSAYRALGWSWSWVAVGLGGAVFGLWIGLEAVFPPGAGEEPGTPFALPAAERWPWLVCRIVGAVVLVPVAEELAFRGYLLRRLQGAELDQNMTGRWNGFAVAVSSVLFGLLHADRWIAGTLAGATFAWAFYRRGRLSDAILAHAVANAALAGYVLATGQWDLW